MGKEDSKPELRPVLPEENGGTLSSKRFSQNTTHRDVISSAVSSTLSSRNKAGGARLIAMRDDARIAMRDDAQTVASSVTIVAGAANKGHGVEFPLHLLRDRVGVARKVSMRSTEAAVRAWRAEVNSPTSFVALALRGAS